jgi:putative Mn2+ efflux pump MntP
MNPIDAVRNAQMYINFVWMGSLTGMSGFVGAFIQHRREQDIKLWAWILGVGLILIVFGIIMAMVSIGQVYTPIATL